MDLAMTHLLGEDDGMTIYVGCPGDGWRRRWASAARGVLPGVARLAYGRGTATRSCHHSQSSGSVTPGEPSPRRAPAARARTWTPPCNRRISTSSATARRPPPAPAPSRLPARVHSLHHPRPHSPPPPRPPSSAPNALAQSTYPPRTGRIGPKETMPIQPGTRSASSQPSPAPGTPAPARGRRPRTGGSVEIESLAAQSAWSCASRASAGGPPSQALAGHLRIMVNVRDGGRSVLPPAGDDCIVAPQTAPSWVSNCQTTCWHLYP